MFTHLLSFARMSVLLTLLGLLVTGCGRKGDLDPPSAAVNKGGDLSQPVQKPGAQERPFLLDPLL